MDGGERGGVLMALTVVVVLRLRICERVQVAGPATEGRRRLAGTAAQLGSDWTSAMKANLDRTSRLINTTAQHCQIAVAMMATCNSMETQHLLHNTLCQLLRCPGYSSALSVQAP